MDAPFLLDHDGRHVPIRICRADHLIGFLKWTIKQPGLALHVVALAGQVADECRRRGLDHYAITYWRPRPCACGGPGLYRVGRQTFCRTCKDQATGHRATWSHRFHLDDDTIQRERAASERAARGHALASSSAKFGHRGGKGR